MDGISKPGRLYLANAVRTFVRSSLLLLLILLEGCISLRPIAPPPASSTPFPEAAFTVAAQTVLARFTQQAGETAVAQLTAMAESASATTATVPQDATLPAATLTPSPLPTATITPEPAIPPSATPSPAAPSVPCNQAELVAHLTLPDNTIVGAGTVLNKIWRVRNSGSCEWTPAYSLVYSGGSLPGGGPTVALPAIIPPGATVDIGLVLTAPAFGGVFNGQWILRSPSGALFGTGPQNQPLSLLIITSQPAPATAGYDLAANMCLAAWTSSSGLLPCPGTQGDLNGNVNLINSTALGGRLASGLTVFTRPPAGSGSWIRGVYPAYAVRPGDHFLAEIACLQSNSGCRLGFQFGYQGPNGSFVQLARWVITEDGRSTPVDVDLSNLAGYSPAFSLLVTNENKGWQAGAWVKPRLQALEQQPTEYTLVWQRTDPNTGECHELRAWLDSLAEHGRALAYNCKESLAVELGRMSLSDQDVAQLLHWVRLLEDFNGEVYSARNGRPLMSWIDFRGQGDKSASSDDIAALDSLAARLYDMIAP